MASPAALAKAWGSWIKTQVGYARAVCTSGLDGLANKDGQGKEAVNVTVATPPDREIIDHNADGNIYYGSAPFGSATTDAVWSIQRESAAGDWQMSAVNQIWSDRLTVTYNNGVAA